MEVKKQSEGGSSNLYTGTAVFKVLNVCPTQQELRDLGFKAEKVPDYSLKRDGKIVGKRVAFVLKCELENENIILLHSIFLEAEQSKSKDGKSEFLDNFGKSSYAMDVNSLPEFIDKASAKPCIKGASELTKFVKVLAGLGEKDEARLTTMREMLAQGNFNEIKNIIKQANSIGNMIKLLIGVKDRKYQEAYSTPMYPSTMNLEFLWKSLNREFKSGHLKSDFGPINFSQYNPGDFDLRIYRPSGVNQGTSYAPTAQSANAAAVPAGGIPDPLSDAMDDLPF